MLGTLRARALRKRPTWAEKLMWRWLRDRRFTGYKFRRQHPMGKYCLDFFHVRYNGRQSFSLSLGERVGVRAAFPPFSELRCSPACLPIRLIIESF